MPTWLLVLIITLGTVLCAFVLFCCGRVLSKAGEKGWKIFIPIYGMFLFFKRTTEMGLLFGILIGAFVLAGLANMLSPYLSAYVLANILVFLFVFCINLSEAFGHNAGFAAGLFFLFPVFIAVLAYGPDRFVRTDSNQVGDAAAANAG